MELKYNIKIKDVDLKELDLTIEELDRNIGFAISDIFNCSNQFYEVKRIN